MNNFEQHFPDSSAAPTQVADHELLRCIGKGSYGEVWLARNVLGSLRAVKVIYRAAFDSDRPYEREFNGILKYEPISRAHPGHVNILQVGRNDAEGYFYYVMELADDASENPSLKTYSPKTLKSELHRRQRLPVSECVELGIAISAALDHLHQRGLVHRDIKPANIIFVGNRPELADIGLVTESDAAQSHLGTKGYLPPEGGGSPSADVYGLGKVLYELSTGLDGKEFPALPSELGTWPDRRELLQLNSIIGRACANEVKRRYSSAAKMRDDLVALGQPKPGKARRRTKLTAVFTVSFLMLAALAWIVFRQPAPSVRSSVSTVSTNEMARRFFDSGRAFQSRRSQPFLTNAIYEFERALEADPKFALAHAAIAQCYNELDHHIHFLPRIVRPKAKEAALAALALDPNLGEAHAAIAVYKLEYEWDWTGAEADFTRALELDPACSYAHENYAALLSITGRHADAIKHARRACELLPTEILPRLNLARRFWAAGDFDQAIEIFNREVVEGGSKSSSQNMEFIGMLEAVGRTNEAWKVFEGYLIGTRSQEDAAPFLEAFANNGLLGVRQLQSRHSMASMITPLRALHFIQLRKPDQAFRELEKAIDERRKDMIFLRVYLQWARLRNDPRFEAVAAKIGLPVAVEK